MWVRMARCWSKDQESSRSDAEEDAAIQTEAVALSPARNSVHLVDKRNDTRVSNRLRLAEGRRKRGRSSEKTRRETTGGGDVEQNLEAAGELVVPVRKSTYLTLW